MRTTAVPRFLLGMVFGLAVFAFALACTPSYAATTTSMGGDGWIFYYQQVTPSNAALFEGVHAAVVTTQRDQAGSAALIHQGGAQAFEYVNIFWLPLGQTYDGVDLAAHPDWQFCGASTAARSVGAVQWVYPDLNERGMHDAILAYLESIKLAGYDGVFFDRGTVALARGPLALEASTCTSDPVTPGASFGAAYQRVILDAHKLGLKVIVNYGGGGRPLPTQIAHIATRVMQEGSPRHSSTGAAASFTRRALEARSNVGYVEELKTQGVDRAEAYFEWAEAAQYHISLTINSGDSGCAGVTSVCWHYGVYSELARVYRGSALNAKPRPFDCVSGVKCLWVRKWQGALVAVNETRHPITETLRLRHHSCRVVTNVWLGRVAQSGRCVHKVRITVPALSGRVYSEATP